MTVLNEIHSFASQHGRQVRVQDRTWCYYRLGEGAPLLWLTGGLRRAALGFAFMQRLAAHHTLIAPDYAPVKSIDEFFAAFDAILEAEHIGRFVLAGQSYGGLLAQAYLARCPQAVEQLVLSSSGPADYGGAWLLVEYLAIGLARIVPEKTVKRTLAGGLLKAIALPEAERAEWQEAIRSVLENDLTRQDVISHFGVAADLIRKRIVRPGVYRDWRGRVVVLSAANDPTQSKSDLPRYEKLFGRPVELIDMGQMGHAAALFDPDAYVGMLERALR
jgi:pimeloyl-ACP methyl ester carboxylesterase